jgi:acetyltransferase-like isoleucine patch superfamily enzyme
MNYLNNCIYSFERIGQKLHNKVLHKIVLYCMKHSGLGLSGRFHTRIASALTMPYKGKTYLSYITDRFYVSPKALISHNNLRIDNNVFLGDNVTIFQAKMGGYLVIGKKTHVHANCIMETGQDGCIEIGEDTHIQPDCHLSAYVGSIFIGTGVQIAPKCGFYPYNHGIAKKDLIKKQPLISNGDIYIEDDAWIGFGAILLENVTIGKGAVVGAGSVVTQNVPDYAIAAGNPARVLKYRKE